jgi:hypothetical protein
MYQQLLLRAALNMRQRQGQIASLISSTSTFLFVRDPVMLNSATVVKADTIAEHSNVPLHGESPGP